MQIEKMARMQKEVQDVVQAQNMNGKLNFLY